jgi:DNA-binding transcriptional LysR family regulator
MWNNIMDANDLLLFARIIEAGSLSRAAQRTGLPKSTVSRRLSLLEAQVGERLLQRTTRKLALTEFGHSLLEHARKVAEEMEAASALAQHRQLAPGGRLRISMPADFANYTMLPMMASFIAEYPQITLELDLSPRRVDLISENFDLALRMGELPDDSSLAARCIMQVHPGLHASPAYIARRGLPQHPDDLLQHDMLCLANRNGDAIGMPLSNGDLHWNQVLPARVLANSPDLLMRMAVAGSGIASSSMQIAQPYIAAGQLQRVLPDWCLPTVSAWAVFPGRRLMPAKTRAFLDWMEAQFGAENQGKN